MTESDETDIRDDIAQIQGIRQVPLLLDVCRRVTGMGFVAIARVTEARWITCAALDGVGLGLAPGDELPIGTTICDHVRGRSDPLVIADAAQDPVFATHVAPALYGFRSCVSMPIRTREGRFFGTLFAVDPAARAVDTPEIRGMFQLFAELISLELRTARQLEQNRRALAAERETARRREEFIGVVAHDLRNPVAALSSGLRMLEKHRDPERDAVLFAEMRKSVMRSTEMINNLLDFAKGRLGGGLATAITERNDLCALVEEIAAEVRLGSGRTIECRLERPVEVDGDARRIRQLVSNLVANAAHHGRSGVPILVEARQEGAEAVVTVSNAGEPIPAEMIPDLFAPFARGSNRHEDGLGLGLYIAAQIAEAHEGTLSVTSDETATQVVYRMPLNAGRISPDRPVPAST